jgi:ribonucleoside-diphosphate reductase alpha chain
MKFIQEKAHEYSQKLGKEKGSFPAFKGSTWDKKGVKHMRNTRVTTIAPTGTISIVANCNPGIEPIFALGYRRKNSMGGTDQEVIEPLFEIVSKMRGFHSEELMHEIANGNHLGELAEKYNIPDDVVEVFTTTHEIDPIQHVKIQAAFQKYVDSAVSKTINLPNSATWRDIARVYQQAWEMNCKGITIFRDGSKDPALQVGTKDKNVEPAQEIFVEQPRNSIEPRKRTEVTRGTTYEIKTEQGNLYVTINEDDKGIVEIFLTIGKSGSFTAGYTEAIGRLVSTALRAGLKPDVIIKQMLGIRTSTPTLNKGMIIYSVPDAIAKVLKKHLEEGQNQMKLMPEIEIKLPKNEEPQLEEREMGFQIEGLEEIIEVESSKTVQHTAPKGDDEPEEEQPKEEEDPSSKYTKNNTYGDMLECPDCGADLEYAEGCILCRSCGYSKCG